MIKAIIFDVGGVLKIDNDQHIRRDVQETLGIAPQDFSAPWEKLTDELGRGVIDEPTFWQKLHTLAGATRAVPQESLLMRQYTKNYQLNEAMVALVQSLQDAGYKTAILSNTISLHADFNRAKGMFEGFDAIVLSHEVGMRKPSPEIFAYTLKQLNTIPEEAVFVDDMEKNVRAAQDFGLHAFVFKNAEEFAEDLRSLGVFV